VDWNAATAAGAFVIGAALGTFATVRVAKVVAAFLADIRDHRGTPDRDQPKE
jgi:hypothetical protein